MTEQEPDPVTKVARNLSAIEEMIPALLTQAVHKANDREIPGGDAMVALAQDADLAEWADLIDAAERHHFATCDLTNHKRCTVFGAEHVEDEDDQDHEDPLRTLLFWTDSWREEHGYPLEGRTPTLVTEAKFLRWCLPWAWDHEPHFEDMARDVHKLRLRMENLLYAGRRAERTRVPCVNPGCDRKPRLIRVYTHDETGDHWRCTACKHRYDADAFRRAQAKQMRSEGAQRFVPVADAIGTLRAQGRSERTIRKWLQPPTEHNADVCTECGSTWEPREYAACPADVEGDEDDECGGILHPLFEGDPEAVVESYCDPRTHRTYVWWPDLWRRHLATATRKRQSAQNTQGVA